MLQPSRLPGTRPGRFRIDKPGQIQGRVTRCRCPSPSTQPRALAPARCPAHGSGPAPVPLACPPPRQLTLRSPTPQTQDGKTANMGGGYFSTDASVNPQMHNWNAVFLRYCDGGSFSGSNATVTNYGGDPTKPLWFRGKHVLKADMNDLLANRGLAKATDVVVSGCSAGAPRCRWLVAPCSAYPRLCSAAPCC